MQEEYIRTSPECASDNLANSSSILQLGHSDGLFIDGVSSIYFFIKDNYIFINNLKINYKKWRFESTLFI